MVRGRRLCMLRGSRRGGASCACLVEVGEAVERAADSCGGHGRGFELVFLELLLTLLQLNDLVLLYGVGLPLCLKRLHERLIVWERADVGPG